jgi:malate synthase
LTDGRKITYPLFQEMLPEELAKIKDRVGEDVYNGGKFDLATELFDGIIANDKLEEFLTLRAYDNLP